MVLITQMNGGILKVRVVGNLDEFPEEKSFIYPDVLAAFLCLVGGIPDGFGWIR